MSLVNFIDREYLAKVSGYLPGLHQYGPDKWNMSCPICQEQKKKAYVFPDKHNMNSLAFKCFKCGTYMPFDRLLSTIDHDIYRQYRKAKFSHSGFSLSGPPLKEMIEAKNDSKVVVLHPDNFFTNILELDDRHPARLYIERRKIPTDQLHRIWYTDTFWSIVKQLKPEQKVRTENDEPRIIFPIMNRTNEYMVGLQGRSLEPNAKLRYVDCQILKEDYMFGLETVDFSKTVIMCEGPIDSLFLENAIGTCGASKKLDMLPFDDRVYYLDQEPRNQHIMKRYKQLIDSGESVVMLPNEFFDIDANDIALKYGWNRTQLTNFVLRFVYRSTRAKLKLAEWFKLTPKENK